MKKAILIISILLTTLSINSFAQAKKDTSKSAAPKKEYQADPAKLYHISLDLTGDQILGLTMGLDNTLHRHSKFTGEQIGNAEDDNKQFAKSISSQAGSQALADYKKWCADTAAKPVVIVTKKLKK